MKYPEEYNAIEKKAYERGWLDSKRSIYRENGSRGGKTRWEGVSLEDRVKYATSLVEARKRKQKHGLLQAT